MLLISERLHTEFSLYTKCFVDVTTIGCILTSYRINNVKCLQILLIPRLATFT